ncbi:SCO4225 family membrane protein [Streptomyces sp. IBSNAI002]|uniref:SCO4225 family membrane protein n=1 Tax=Streptomyces sp. IBSNAI002 TaxID=3457500 RepID=UPI003FD5F1EA
MPAPPFRYWLSDEEGEVVRRRRSRLEVLVPAGYLAVVLGLLVWVDVLVRTGDAGFAGVWPVLVTAPLSLAVMGLIAPAPKSLGEPEIAPPVHTGPVPPEPLPLPLPGEPPVTGGPPPADPGSYDLPASELSDMWLGFGFYGVVLACALCNATALWALVRGLSGLLARRRRAQVCAMNPAQA